MSDFAANLQSQIASTLMAEPASTPSTPTPEPVSAQPEPTQSTPADTPATPPVDAPSPDTSAAQEPEEDEFSFPDEVQTPPAEAQQEQATEAKPDDELGDLTGKLPKEVQEAFLKTSRGRRLYNGFRLAQEMLKPSDQGGLGRLPSVDEIREFHQAHQDLRLMAHEFHNGNPEYAQNWVKQWFQPGPQGYSEGARQVARSFVPTVASMANNNPQAAELYRELVTPAVMNYVEEWYNRAANETTREARTIAYNVAMAMEQDLTGKTRAITEDMLEPTYRGQQQASPQQSEVDSKIKYINDWEQRQTQAAQQQFQQAMGSAINQKVMADVDHALKGLEDALGKVAYGALRQQTLQDVYRSVNQNPANLRNFIIARDEASRQRTPEAIQAAADAWRSVARPVIRSLRAKIMAESGQKLMARSAERHTILEEASQKRGTTGVAQPTAKNLAQGTPQAIPGESFEDRMHRLTYAALSA